MVKLDISYIKINNIFKQSLLLFNILSFITSQIIWVDYEIDKQSATYTNINIPKNQAFAVNFQDYEVPYYIKVTIFPEKDTPTPLLYFSPTSLECLSERQILARRTDGKPVSLFIKKEEFLALEGELYICVTCQEDNCGYTLKFEGKDVAEIELNSVFSYIITQYNRQMDFKVIGNAEEGSFITIGIEGSETAELIIENQEKLPIPLDNGKIITFPLENELENEDNNYLTSFEISNGNIGDYLTLNIHIVKDAKAPDNLLYPNGPVIMGVIGQNEEYFPEECFPISAFKTDKFLNISNFYLTGKIHSKYANVFLTDENNIYIEGEEQEISDGLISFLIKNDGKKKFVCFEFSFDSNVRTTYVAFSISISEPINIESIYNFNPPQIIGETYRRMIPKGSFGVYHGGKMDKNKKYDFNAYNRKGVVETYITQCDNYPNCIYSIKDFENMIKPKRLNRMTIYEKRINRNLNALDPYKYIMLVYCKDDGNDNKGYCEFETSINTIGKEKTLVENEKYSKHVLKGEKGFLRIDFKGGMRIQRLTIDIMIYSGDVIFKIKEIEDILNNDELNKDKFKLVIINTFFQIKYFIILI